MSDTLANVAVAAIGLAVVCVAVAIPCIVYLITLRSRR